MSTPELWTLTLGKHQPVPVTLDRTNGPTTHYLTSATLPLNPPGRHLALHATLTAPDGSQRTGIGSIDGTVLHSDGTRSIKLSFTSIKLT
jgi:hypothetical protein